MRILVSFPSSGTSRGTLTYQRVQGKYAFWRRLPPRGISTLTYPHVQGKYAFWRRLPPRDISTLTYPHVQGKYAKARPSAVLSTRVRTNARRNAHAFSYRFPPAGHRYAYTPARATPAHTKTQKRVMAPFTPAGHRAVGLHTGARAGHNAPRSPSPTCASPSTPARTPAQTPPRPLSRAFQPPAPPPSYRNILARRLTPPQTPHAPLRRALQPRSVPSLRAAPRAPSLSRQTL